MPSHAVTFRTEMDNYFSDDYRSYFYAVFVLPCG